MNRSTMTVSSLETGSTRSAVVAELRALLQRRGQGGALIDDDRLAAGEGAKEESRSLDGPDAWLRAVPAGTLALVLGEWSSGKTTVTMQRVMGVTRRGERAAIVDTAGRIFPPALASLGGRLDRVLIVRAGRRRALWAAEQLLRSGLFAVVVTVGLETLEGSKVRRLQLAAERGNATAFLLLPRSTPSLSGLAMTRFQVTASTGSLLRGRGFVAPARPIRVHVERRGRANRGTLDAEVALA